MHHWHSTLNRGQEALSEAACSLCECTEPESVFNLALEPDQHIQGLKEDERPQIG